MISPEYLTLRDDRKVRIEINMNSIGSFNSITGKELFEIKEGNKTDATLIRTLAWCSAIEGEACEGREFVINEIEFGRLMGVPELTAFVKIFMNQAMSSEQKKSKPPTKKTTRK